MSAPLSIELRGVSRLYLTGEGSFAALKEIDLVIGAGELVAVMGPSGSGKSTLMNVLGCLDRPTSGVFRVSGQETRQLDADGLAALRRERFGFVFQRYNLLPSLTALENVEMPSIYAGADPKRRRTRARELLKRLNLDDRLHHRPSQLSGGQQQRVSIARALMNGGEMILADEPTGALDTHVGEEVLTLLKELHFQGHTVVIVTHDPKVAEHTERIIELRDGEIISDRRSTTPHSEPKRCVAHTACPTVPPMKGERREIVQAAREALRMALLAMRAHRLRTFLTMLGIIIGIASVVAVCALGAGGKARVLADVRGIGTNTVDVYPGNGWGDEKAASIQTLTPTDAAAIAHLDSVSGVTPAVSTRASVRFGNVSLSGMINGVGEQYFQVHNVEILQGAPFSEEDTRELAQVAVIDDNARQKLFTQGENPLGQVILLGQVPVRIIGVGSAKGNPLNASSNLNVWMPYTAVIGRMLGRASLRGITARIRDDAPMELAVDSVTQLLLRRHGRRDFFTFNADTVRKAVESTAATLTWLIGSIAVISLVVGGIGVMNIMLVSVTERTREIGIRMAVGARQRDILQQFLIEAVLVCLMGGGLGVVLALLVGGVYSHLSTNFPMIFSASSIAAALCVSTLIGVVFGYLPARQAARLDPIQALARE